MYSLHVKRQTLQGKTEQGDKPRQGTAPIRDKLHMGTNHISVKPLNGKNTIADKSHNGTNPIR